jgi:hypothetical protein
MKGWLKMEKRYSEGSLGMLGCSSEIKVKDGKAKRDVVIQKKNIERLYVALGLKPCVLRKVIKAHVKVLKYGLKTGNERVIVIDADTGRTVADKTGTPERVAWTMLEAYKGKLVVVHNHPRNIPFSSLDLFTFGTVRQSLCMGVQCHNGRTYTLRKTVDVPFAIPEDALAGVLRRVIDSPKHKGKTYAEKSEVFVSYIARKMRWLFLKGDEPDGQ